MGEFKKDRLAFVSGTILVWGVALVQLWNVSAHFQTGGHIHAWTMNTPGQGVQAALWVFWFLTALMTFGGCAVFLSVLHILSHGLSLMDEPGGQAAPSGSSSILATLGYSTYAAVFIQWFIVLYMLALIPLLLLSAGLEHLMGHIMSTHVANWIARMLAVIVLMLLLVRMILPRLRPMLARLLESGTNMRLIYFLALFGFGLGWLSVIESCYTVSLSVDAKIIRHDQGATIAVSLGGATSSLNAARLQLTSEQGAVLQNLVLHEATEPGDYFCYIPAAALTPGVYRVTLQYPHTSLSSSFPYIRGATMRSQSFLVLP